MGLAGGTGSAYPDALKQGRVITVELNPPLASDSAETADRKLGELEERLQAFATGRRWYANLSDGHMGQPGMAVAGLLNRMSSLSPDDKSHVILNLSCNHTQAEVEGIVDAALSEGYSHFLLVPGDQHMNADGTPYKREITSTLGLAEAVRNTAGGSTLYLGASFDPHREQFPKTTLTRLLSEYEISFLQTQPVSYAEGPKVGQAQKNLREHGLASLPVAYGVLKGDKEGKLLNRQSGVKITVPADVVAAYAQGIPQHEQVSKSMACLHLQRGITNFVLMNSADVPVADKIVQNYRNLLDSAKADPLTIAVPA
ncbi:hypothetical protein HYU40_05150 [Candidatus Woesearchaeota archaeon]|nr:hypothetical protein [Candidatus Woesearchaeota archaeon]